MTKFEVSSQSGHEKIESLTLRPLKEVLWSDELIGALSKKSELYPGCSGRMEGILTALKEEGEVRGEELWYGSVFPKDTSILDYVSESTLVFEINSERLRAQEESFRKEYAGMYRSALREAPVPPPEACLLSHERTIGTHIRKISTFALRDRQQLQRLSMGGEPSRSFFGNLK